MANLYDCWFDVPKRSENPAEAVHALVFPHIKNICEDQREHFLQNKLNAQLYSNREPMLFDWWSDITIDFVPIDANLENVLQSTVDTLESVIAKYQYKAKPTPRGVAFDSYLRARQLDRYLYAMFLEQDVYKHMPRQFVDGLVYGDGYVKIGIDGGDIFTERVCPHEIVVDQRQGECPREMFQLKMVSRLHLLNKFGKRKPELREAIMHAPAYGYNYVSKTSTVHDMVVLAECWVLPDDAGPGRHALAIETATLIDEVYKRTRFPFVHFQPKTSIAGGYYGYSLVEDLTGYQIRLNEMNEKIRMGHDLMIVPRIFLDMNQEILGSQLDNELGKVIRGRFNGVPPQALTWNAFNPEIYNERDRMGEKALNFAGVTEMSAQGKLPPGTRLDSGEAINEYAGREDSRHARLAQKYEALPLEYASHYVELLAELGENSARRKKFYVTKFMAKGIDFDKAWGDLESYQLTVEASSVTNMTPAARTQILDEWAAKGKIDQEQYRGWSGFPDIEHYTDLLSAATDRAECMIDQMLDGKAVIPDPNDNHALVFKLVRDTYLHLRCLEPESGEKEKYQRTLQLMSNCLQATKNYLQPPNAEAPPGAQSPLAPPVDPSMAGAPQMQVPGMIPGMGPTGMPPGVPTGAPLPGVSYPAAQGIAL